MDLLEQWELMQIGFDDNCSNVIDQNKHEDVTICHQYFVFLF